jgi:hypothetical protein
MKNILILSLFFIGCVKREPTELEIRDASNKIIIENARCALIASTLQGADWGRMDEKDSDFVCNIFRKGKSPIGFSSDDLRAINRYLMLRGEEK